MVNRLTPISPRLPAVTPLRPAEVGTLRRAGVGRGGARRQSGIFDGLPPKKRARRPEEVAAFAAAFRGRAVDPGVGAWASRAIDIVGTGGDHAGGFNISSVVVLVLASAGVVVMKHGNRGITSRCGSADLLAAFGVDLGGFARSASARRWSSWAMFSFSRRRTIRASGTSRRSARRWRRAASGRSSTSSVRSSTRRGPRTSCSASTPEPWVPDWPGRWKPWALKPGLVVHGVLGPGKGIDELTTATVNHVQGVGRLRGMAGEWRAGDVGLAPRPFSDLVGGDPAGQFGADRGAARRPGAGRPGGHDCPQRGRGDVDLRPDRLCGGGNRAGPRPAFGGAVKRARSPRLANFTGPSHEPPLFWNRWGEGPLRRAGDQRGVRRAGSVRPRAAG